MYFRVTRAFIALLLFSAEENTDGRAPSRMQSDLAYIHWMGHLAGSLPIESIYRKVGLQVSLSRDFHPLDESVEQGSQKLAIPRRFR